MFYTGSRASYLLTGFLTGMFCLALGWVGGQEYLRYEIRSSLASAFSGLQPNSRQAGRPTVTHSEPVPNPSPAVPSPIEVSLVSKRLLPSDPTNNQFEDRILINQVYRNTGSKDVRAFGGELTITDLLGNVIKVVTVACNDPIASNTSIKWPGVIKYNEFKSSDQDLANADRSSLKTSFHTTKIVFSDGTEESFPDD